VGGPGAQRSAEENKMQIAGMFPGQGSEYVGMLKLISNHKATQEIFNIIKKLSGRDVLDISLNGPENLLKQPLNAQLAVFGADVCYWHLLKERFEFYALAGHSLGFYSAAYASGALKLEDCIKIIIEAYNAMHDISKNGKWSMAAVIGLRIEEMESACKDVGDVFVANINSATQTVISGKTSAVEKASEIALRKGALNVKDISIPYPLHTPFMNGIEKKLSSVVANMEIQQPVIPVIDHTNAGFMHRDSIRDVLINQLTRKVCWKDAVSLFINNGIMNFLEIGPGDVLSKLVRWINRDAQALKAEEV
jgi:[acyl-carrier-protein] S-malonyltransferase